MEIKKINKQVCLKYKARVLITGGLGFIGSNFLMENLKNNNDILYVCVDKITYASHHELLDEFTKFENFVFIKMDINDKKLEKVFKLFKFNYIVNFAAESHVDNSINDPLIFYKTNVLGTLNLLNLSLKYMRYLIKFIQISTDEVYGSNNNSAILFDEKSRLNPSSPYSSSKASADLLCISFNKTYNLPFAILRPSNNFGCFQNKEKFIPHSIYNLANNRNIEIYGNGENKRNRIYVLDCVKFITFMISENKETFGIFNISSPIQMNTFSNLSIANKLLEEFTKFSKNKDFEIDFIKDRLGHDLDYSMSNEKIVCLYSKLLDKQFVFTSFDDKVHEMVKFYLNEFKNQIK